MSLAALLLLLMPPFSSFADEINIRASVDKNAAALNDQIVLTVTVSGSRTDLPDPQLPAMPNFSVYSSGRSQNISFVNGAVSSSVEYTYVMTPRFVGKAVIGPIGLTVGARTYETTPIEIQVVRPNQAPGAAPSPTAPVAGGQPRGAPAAARGGAPDVFVTASLDKQKACVNEQVVLTVRFHWAVQLLGNPEYIPPATNGFLTEDLPPERHGRTQLRGRAYNVSEIKTALFPAQPGRLTISPAVVKAQVQAELAVDPFAPDFFQRFFSQGLLSAQTREIKSEPLTLKVEALPSKDKPPSFTGAVGQFRITAGVDKRKGKVGEALNLTTTIEGAGNLKALGAPKFPELSSFRVYDTLSTMNLNKDNDVVRGSKIYKTVLVPKVSGTLTIPSIPFSYFDPAKGEYIKAGTPPMEVDVAPSTPAAAGTSFVAAPTGGGELTPLVEDILYVKESVDEPLLSRALARVARGTLVHLLPLAAFLFSLGLSVYRERLSLDPAGYRARSALSRARKLLREAGTAVEGDPAALAGRAADALTGFIADKLNRPAGGLTLREARELLQTRHPRLGEPLLERLKALWEELEQLRFAGDGAEHGSSHALLASLKELLEDLEKGMRS